jgi:hypothetical protein
VKPELRRVGNSQSPLVVIDDFSGSAEDIARIADALAPYPPITQNYYPGVRRPITPRDGDANDYAMRTCREAAPFVGGAFDVDSFDLKEASFSIVTIKPGRLGPAQRIPHFDSPDQGIIAMLHFLRVPRESGTAFYRHRASGIERVTNDNVGDYVQSAQAAAESLPPDSGYINASNEYFEQIGLVEAVPDRLIMYHGSLLHSGVIPAGMSFSADPREGRLTGNFFLIGRRKAKSNG